MTYKILYLKIIKHDRKAIKQYLSQYSATAAKRLFEKIKNNMELVKENPYMYETFKAQPQFRRMVIDDFLLFYKVIEENKVIEVHHILYGKIDYEKFF